MGQSEVVNLLGRSRDWLTAGEIADKLNVSGRVVRRVLMVLFRFNEVLRKKFKNEIHFKYIYKLR